jgi:CelD/BcsL family acetyltransferase involved in cellulose biosynthesis
MGAEFAVETLKPAELSAHAHGLWASFRAADPALRSPYFDLRYILAAGEAAPGAEVAVISRQGRIEGFLPFQRRGKLIQPIAAPLTDYHGLLAAPGAGIDLEAVIAALGARRFRFSALVGGHLSLAHISVRPAMAADLSAGLEAYLERRGSDFLKDKRRRARRLAEAHGELSFALAPATGTDLDLIFRLKADQFRRTGQHDVFSSPWTTRFLRRLASEAAPDFGLRFAALRAGGRIVAAEVGLLSGDAYHLWFPVYDPEFARYSPGALATLETIRVAADLGLRLIDFGPAGETYKRDFADPGAQVFEGDITTGGVVETIRNAANLALAGAPEVRRALSVAGRRLDRRWDRITACEPRLEGRVTAASVSLGDLARRRPRTSIGLGLGLGLGAGLVSLMSD